MKNIQESINESAGVRWNITNGTKVVGGVTLPDEEYMVINPSRSSIALINKDYWDEIGITDSNVKKAIDRLDLGESYEYEDWIIIKISE